MTRLIALGAWLSCLLMASMSLAAESIVIAHGTAPDQPKQPQLCIDQSGTVHLVFGVKDDTLYCRSEDGGKTFSEPAKLPSYRAMALGMRRGPRVAASEDSICVSVIGGRKGEDVSGNLLTFCSSDKGKTWEEPVVVNDVPNSAREGLHGMAVSPRGKMACVWLDLRNKMTEVRAAFSHDQGKTWGANILVYHSPDGSVCECCHPSVTFDASDVAHVMWRNQLKGARDLFVSSTTDGKVFSKAQKQGGGSWKLDHCPMDGGSLASLSAGGLATTWRRDTSIFFLSGQGKKELLLGTGEQPWIAANANGPYVAWVTKRGGALLLQQPQQAKPIQLADNAVDPCIVSESKKDGIVMVAWEDQTNKEGSIRCQLVSPKQKK